MSNSTRSKKTCTLRVNLFSGGRTSLPLDAKPLLTVRDGNQRSVNLPHNGYLDSPSIELQNLPFVNNLGDNYAVVASADNYEQAGFYPVKVSPEYTAVADIMLLGKDAGYNFGNAGWDKLTANYSDYAALLAEGAADDQTAANRYDDLKENRTPALACFFNLVTAMSQIQLPVKTPLAYIKELIWDDTMAQDRFFAWADPALIDQVVQAAAHGAFSPEVGTAVFHPGATRSWKQIQFGEANVQLTFHENDKNEVNGLTCVKVEPDIDYYRDEAAHALLEVLVNKFTNTLTDPRQVYVLRWIAGRHAGIPNFEPPYTIE